MIVALPIPVSLSNLDFLVERTKGEHLIDFNNGEPPLAFTPKNTKKFVSALIDGGHILKYSSGTFKIHRI